MKRLKEIMILLSQIKHLARIGKKSPHKYITTAVEAMIGSIYKEEGKSDKIIELIDSWCK